MIKFFKIAATAVLISLVPASYSTTDGSTVGTVRISGACGQATGCQAANAYICSTFHQDWLNYKCASGCGDSQG